jgi:hypothetical protein
MSAIVNALNQPVIKQGIKYTLGAVAFGRGGLALYDAIRGKIYTKFARNPGEEYSVVDRITFLFAQISFVLAAAVSPLGLWVLSHTVHRIFTSAQLERVFGPNTVFEANWKHPRHFASLAAVGLAIPVVINRLFIPPTGDKAKDIQSWALFIILTSRVVLHQVNRLAHLLFK